MAIAILGDTHMPKGNRELPPECLEAMAGAELIVHTGDFSGIEVLDLIGSLGPPVVAVRGNVETPELAARLEEEARFEHRGAHFGLVHDSGPRKGRLERMRSRFPDVDAVLFGHSHLPLHESGEDGFQIFNPGSPTERRRAPRRSFGLAEVTDGRVSFRHVWI